MLVVPEGHFSTLLMLDKNAMNAAEITDKLGLHSLRQRAWASPPFLPKSKWPANIIIPVYPINLRHIWGRPLRRFGMAEQLTPKGWT